MKPADYALPCKALVTYSPSEWRLEDVLIREPGEHELLVQTVATGICHTDVQNVGGICPRILGHEGSGIVLRTHPSVRRCAVGDPVLLSFPRCGACYMCHTGHPAHCRQNNPLTIHACEPNYMLANDREDGRLLDDGTGRKRIIPAGYFGQSSFSSIALVKESSVVNAKLLIREQAEMSIFAPLGCGVQTGACAITNVAKPEVTDTVAVIGLGAVGISAVTAARIRGVKTIVGIDLVQSRLDKAKEFGVTHQINSSSVSSGNSLASQIRMLPPYDHFAPLPLGPSIIVDTTGIPAVLQEALKAVSPLGTVIQITNSGPGSTLSIGLPEHMKDGIHFVGTIQGDADPDHSIAMLIDWYRTGQLPLDRLEKRYPAEAWKDALAALHSGTVIKAVLEW